MAVVEVTVSVADGHLSDLGKIVERCRQSGLNVTQILDQIGVIVGSIDPQRITALRQIAGVAAVEESREIGIEPPDSEIQ